MAGNTIGPDWGDIEASMRVLGALHSGSVEIIISAQGIGGTGGLRLEVAMSLAVLPGSSLPKRVMVESTWPCPETRSFAGHVFAGLLKLDYAMSETYENDVFWQEA